jgi:hypothetical protein
MSGSRLHRLVDAQLAVAPRNQFEMSSKKSRMRIDVAVDRAKRVQRDQPRKLLCGSLALHLYGYINKKIIHDLDFCMTSDDYVGTGNFDSYYHDTGGCILWRHFNKVFPVNHCLFVHNVSSFVLGANIEVLYGLKCQSLHQIIHWKKIFNRDKDATDLVYLPDELFEI